MLGIYRICFIGFSLVVSIAAQAEESLRYGLFPAATIIDVNDPNGPAKNTSFLSLFSGVIISDIGRDSRLFVHAYYEQEEEIEGDTINIHQDVTRSGASLSYQINSRLTRNWKPWFGLGVGYNDELIVNRYTVTAGGAQNAVFDDIKSGNMTVLVSAATEWKMGRDWDMGLQLQIEEPFSDGVSVSRIGFYFVY